MRQISLKFPLKLPVKLKSLSIITSVVLLSPMLLVTTASNAITKAPPVRAEVNDLRLRSSIEPTSLNPVDGANWNAADVHALVLESLLQQDPQTLEWRPRLADVWERSADERQYTFRLREGLKWSDGTPLTADDVKFSFDAIFDDRFAAAQVRPYYQGIERVEKVDARTVRFILKNPYFGNFISCAQMSIVPKHVYGNPDDSPKLQTTIVGSGAYAFDTWQSGRMIRLKKNPAWWGWAAKVPESIDRPKFISIYFVSENAVALEMLRKHEIDYTPLGSDEYRRLEEDPARGFAIEKVRNLVPKSVRSLTFNLQKDLFKDRDLRRALSFVVDRKLISDRFFHGFLIPASGPWYSQSLYANPATKPDPYDPAHALSVLRARGWDDSDGDFILDHRVGNRTEKLKFTVLTKTPDDMRFLSVIRQDARQIGVDIDLKLVSEVVFNEAMRTGHFDAAMIERGAVWVEFDPSVSWSSKSLPPNGYNFGRFSSAEADRLVRSALDEPIFEKRIPIMRALYDTITEDAPELFLFNEQDSFYAVTNRVGRERASYNYDIGTSHWSLPSSSSK